MLIDHDLLRDYASEYSKLLKTEVCDESISLCNESDPGEMLISAVSQNHEVINFNYNWSQLLVLEAYYIKKHDPAINHGLKA